MMAKSHRRRFGAVRELPSGRWQARYRGLDGVMRPADETFPSKTDAEVWLTRKEAEILNGEWIDPDAGKVLLADYCATWIDERPNLRPKTIRLYRYLLRRHIAPHFEGKTVGEVKEPHMRRWRKKLLDSGVSDFTAAKAYRLLKAVFNTAVDDQTIRRNPAVSRALARRHPASGRSCRSPRYMNSRKRLTSATACSSCSLSADAGANLRELMERMGRSSARAALIYLHSTSERQRVIADSVGKAAKAALRKSKAPKAADAASGMKVARRRGRAL